MVHVKNYNTEQVYVPVIFGSQYKIQKYEKSK